MQTPPDDLLVPSTPPIADFLATKEHRRFTEFAAACRREKYIGVCFGPPGVGKTLSARHYSSWDNVAPWLTHDTAIQFAIHDKNLPQDPAAFDDPGIVLWTPTVTTSPKQLNDQLRELGLRYSRMAEHHETPGGTANAYFDRADPMRGIDLLIVDEADRLKNTGLEQLRDLFDRNNIGLILIGMPGFEKRLARYPQLYSRIGFAHRYNPLSESELRFVLEHHWDRLGLTLNASDFTDAEALAAVARITGGNFRLVHRLFAQITRILHINHGATITREVVEAARETLVIGKS